MIDLHTHILPGLDDGANDLAESLAMAQVAHNDGIKTIVATPHVLQGVFDNEKDTILAAVAALNTALQEQNIALEVLPGAEYYLEPDLPQRLSREELLTINDNGRYLLVELPSGFIPESTPQLLYEIQLQGVTPIIAHPERNLGFIKRPGDLQELISRGILAQITSASITGFFGKEVKQSALGFLKQGLVQLLGSDAHSPRGRAPLLSQAVQAIEKSLGTAAAEQLAQQNSYRIVKGETLESYSIPRKRRGWTFFRHRYRSR